MRSVVLFAAVLIAAPAQAKTWAAEDCSLTVVSAEDAFEVYPLGQDRAPTICKVEHWPISNPVGLLSCDDGQKVEIELSAASIRFNGTTLPEWTDERQEACE